MRCHAYPATYNPFISRTTSGEAASPRVLFSSVGFGDGKHGMFPIYGYTAGPRVVICPVILGVIAIYLRQVASVAAKWNGTGRRYRDICASCCEDDSVRRRVSTVDLRIVGPGVDCAHHLVDSIVAFGGRGVAADVDAFAV